MIKKLIAGEEARKPMFTPYQTSNIIKEAETRIIDLKKSLDGMTQQLKDYKIAYEKMQSEYDSIASRLQDDEALLEFMSRIQNKVSDTKELRVGRAESHNDMKEREKKKLRAEAKIRFPWTDYAVLVLREEKRFTTPDDLWELVDIKFGTEKTIEEHGQKVSTVKWGAINACWLVTCKNTRAGGKRKASNSGMTTEQLVDVEGRIGLRDWTDTGFRPYPQYKPLANLKNHAS